MYAVKWNKDSFESLARDNNTKILITSLVANQIKDEQSPGISRKGSGSIILLHGSVVHELANPIFDTDKRLVFLELAKQ